MGIPYVSVRRLVYNSLAAMLSAIEVYNKPQITYRDEVTVVLIVNAWELALKAALRQANVRIFYRKEPKQPYRTISVEDALKHAMQKKVFPSGVDAAALSANIRALIEYRNRTIHLYNAPGLGEMIYPFLQQSVLNYRDFVLERFNKDLADSITWQLLPLGAKAPTEPIQFMQVDPKAIATAELEEFLGELRQLLDEAQAAGADPLRVATIYDVHMRSTKAMTSADLMVGVTGDAGAKVVIKKEDPNQTHPYTATELVTRVNAKRNGRTLTSYDHQALCWKKGLRDDPQMAWKHSNAATHVWSGNAVALMVGLTDQQYDSMRQEYGDHLRARKKD